MFGSAVVLMGAVGVVALASTVGVASGLQHGHHGPASADGGHHGATPEDAHNDHHGADVKPEEHDDPGTTGEHVHSPDSNDEPGAPAPVNEPAGESATPPEVPTPAEVPASPDVPAPAAVPPHDDHSDHDHGDSTADLGADVAR